MLHHIYNDLTLTIVFFKKLLEGIGIISKGDSDMATSPNFNYQDDINVGLECENDMEAAPEEEGLNGVDNAECSENIHMAIKKVFILAHYFHWFLIKFQLRRIVRSVRSSPQRRQHWFGEVERMNAQLNSAECRPILMLILDMKMCWSSTHQMLHKFSLLSN